MLHTPDSHMEHREQVNGCLYQPSSAHTALPPRFATIRSLLALLSHWAWREGYSRERGIPGTIPALYEVNEHLALPSDAARAALVDWCLQARDDVSDVAYLRDRETTLAVWRDLFATLPREVPERYATWWRACMAPQSTHV